MKILRRFHLAFKIKDLESTRDFYIGLLGCDEGRSTASWTTANKVYKWLRPQKLYYSWDDRRSIKGTIWSKDSNTI